MDTYNPMGVKKFTIISTALSILLYFADVISDISLAMKYYENGHNIFFILTLFLVVLSAVVSSLLSFYMYWFDKKSKEFKVSKKCWILRAIFLICGIAPVLRSFDALWFAWKSRNGNKNQKLYYAQKMTDEISNGLYLRLYEAFVESSPQLVLQMYILVKIQTQGPNTFTDTEIGQCFFTMLISAISASSSISSAVLAYANSHKISLGERKKSKVLQLTFLFLWRFFEVISRIIAISVGISATPYFHIVFAIRYIITAVLLHFTRTNYDKAWNEKSYHVLLLSVINMFVYFNPEENSNRRKYIFYVAMFVENTAIMIFWILFSSPHWNLMLPAVVIQTSCFCLGIVFMIICYRYFNPYSYQKRTQEDNLSDDFKDVTQNDEASTELEVVQNSKTTEI